MIFAGSVVAGSLPLALLDPQWQMRLTAALVDQAPLPLMALGLVHLEAWLFPDDDRVLRRRDRFASLAVAVSIWYLLLVPLQIQAALLLNQAATTAQNRQVNAIEREFRSIRTRLAATTDIGELQSLRRLRGGIPLTAAEQALPLEPLRQRLLVNLQATRAQAIRQVDAAETSRWRGLITVSARNGLCSLAIGLAFAAAASRQRGGPSLLRELSRGLGNGRAGTGARSLASADKEAQHYLASIAGPVDAGSETGEEISPAKGDPPRTPPEP